MVMDQSRSGSRLRISSLSGRRNFVPGRAGTLLYSSERMTDVFSRTVRDLREPAAPR